MIEAKFIIARPKRSMYNSYITFILHIKISSGKDLWFSADVNKSYVSDFIRNGINLRKRIGKKKNERDI